MNDFWLEGVKDMEKRLERLEKHCLGLSTEVVWREITQDGCVLARDGEGNVYEDRVTTHHLVDLFHVLDGYLYYNNILQSCQWFIKRPDINDPFFVTTLAQSSLLSDEDKKALTEAVLRHRRRSGLIEIFAGFLDGGSLFSTLWAVKNLLLLQNENEYQDVIIKALKAVRNRWEDLHRFSFKGFYLDMALKSRDPELLKDCEKICGEIIGAQQDDGLWDQSVLYSMYIANNLLNCVENKVKAGDSQRACDKCLDKVFDLAQEVEGMPKSLKDISTSSPETVFLQTVIRAIIVGVNRLRMDGRDVSSQVAMALLGTWPTLYHTTGSLDARLKKMLQQYGDIEKEFRRQRDAAAQLLNISPYERNVFIMMPFQQKQDEQFERIEEILKYELKQKGFQAWLSTDQELDSGLWGNITSYMTGCKYGVAVFTRRDNLVKGLIEQDFNPNVSLELGFMLGRAKRVLILKDKELETLPTDLATRLYKEFDLRQAGRELPPLISQWAEEILAKENKNE
jgi:predicted nucleotide-binding protein